MVAKEDLESLGFTCGGRLWHLAAGNLNLYYDPREKTLELMQYDSIHVPADTVEHLRLWIAAAAAEYAS